MDKKSLKAYRFLAAFPVTGVLGIHCFYAGKTQLLRGCCHTVLSVVAVLTLINYLTSSGDYHTTTGPYLGLMCFGLPAAIISYVVAIAEWRKYRRGNL